MSSGGLSNGRTPTRYEECVFDRSTWKGPGFSPGRASFVNCSFRNVRLTRLFFTDAASPSTACDEHDSPTLDHRRPAELGVLVHNDCGPCLAK